MAVADALDLSKRNDTGREADLVVERLLFRRQPADELAQPIGIHTIFRLVVGQTEWIRYRHHSRLAL